MADALTVHVASGTSLPDAQLAEARALVSEIKRKRGEPARLCELAVVWVEANPQPVALGAVDCAVS